MKKVKNIIIILIIIVIIIISICILLLRKSAQESGNRVNMNEFEVDTSEDFIKTIGFVNDYSTFISVEKMLNNYMINVQNENKEAIYDLLDKDYTIHNNITLENVLNHTSELVQYDENVRIRAIYSTENMDNSSYYISCMLEKNNRGTEKYFTLYQDKQNLTYCIEHIDKATYDQKIASTELEIINKTIEKNEHNKTIFVNPTEEEIAKKYFEDFIENALYYPEYAYTLLSEEYKNIAFPSLEDFKVYLDKNKEALQSYDISNLKSDDEFESVEEYNQYLMNLKRLKLKQYQITKKVGYNIYTCIDNNDNYYVFTSTTPFNYSIILDNYTIPTDEYVKEYTNTTEVQKVILNIQKFFMGINDGNYGYSYSVLSESFKNNKYPAKSDFVSYVKQNFFEENEIKYISCEKENGVYIYKIKLTDAAGTSSESKEFNMIVKLNSGTDFEMSFGTN